MEDYIAQIMKPNTSKYAVPNQHYYLYAVCQGDFAAGDEEGSDFTNALLRHVFLNSKKYMPELLNSFEKPARLPIFDTDVSWTASVKFFQENV